MCFKAFYDLKWKKKSICATQSVREATAAMSAIFDVPATWIMRRLPRPAGSSRRSYSGQPAQWPGPTLAQASHTSPVGMPARHSEPAAQLSASLMTPAVCRTRGSGAESSRTDVERKEGEVTVRERWRANNYTGFCVDDKLKKKKKKTKKLPFLLPLKLRRVQSVLKLCFPLIQIIIVTLKQKSMINK